MSRSFRFLGVAATLGLGLAAAVFSTPASARVVVGFGFGVPVVVPPVVYAPPPVVYPAPVVVAPQPTYISQPAPTWYYCNNPRGYYPNVTACASGWRAVPAQPPS